MPPTHNRSVFLTVPEIHSDWSRDPPHMVHKEMEVQTGVLC